MLIFFIIFGAFFLFSKQNMDKIQEGVSKDRTFVIVKNLLTHPIYIRIIFYCKF
jgi:hypothetical protein